MYDDDDDFLGKDTAFIKQVQAKIKDKEKENPELEILKAEKISSSNLNASKIESKKEEFVNIEQAKQRPVAVIAQAKPEVEKLKVELAPVKEAPPKPKVAEVEKAEKLESKKPVPVQAKNPELAQVELAKPKPEFRKLEAIKLSPVNPVPIKEEVEDDFLAKDPVFIKQVCEKAKAEKKPEVAKEELEPAELKFSNVPSRDGDEDAIDAREIKVKVIKSGESVLRDIEKAQEKLEKDAEIRYDDIVLAGRNLSILSKLLWGVFIFAASILGVFMLANIVDFVESLASITPVLRYFFIALMVLFGVIILILLVKIYLSLRRFSKACDIDLSTIKALSEREEFKKAANKDYLKVKNYLVNNLQAYDTTYLEKLKLDGNYIKAIKGFKNYLLELEVSAISTKDWIEKYKDLFESKLTEVAKNRIVQYAKQVGYSTAISPFPFLDRLVVLSATLAMIKDVFAIYNLKLGKMDSMKLFAMSVSSVYFSGLTQEGATNLSENLFDCDFASQMGLDSLSALAGKFILPKLSEGSINAFLVWRLGKFTLKKLNLK